MKKTISFLKSIYDGLTVYILWYLFTAFVIWIGIYSINLISVNYIQVLGSLLVVRQVIGVFNMRTDKHLKKDKIKNRITELKEINLETLEGQYLFAALAKITTESQRDKTPDEVMEQLFILKEKMQLNDYNNG